MEQHLRIDFSAALALLWIGEPRPSGAVRDERLVTPCGSNRGRWRSIFAGAPWRPGTKPPKVPGCCARMARHL